MRPQSQWRFQMSLETCFVLFEVFLPRFNSEDQFKDHKVVYDPWQIIAKTTFRCPSQTKLVTIRITWLLHDFPGLLWPLNYCWQSNSKVAGLSTNTEQLRCISATGLLLFIPCWQWDSRSNVRSQAEVPFIYRTYSTQTVTCCGTRFNWPLHGVAVRWSVTAVRGRAGSWQSAPWLYRPCARRFTGEEGWETQTLLLGIPKQRLSFCQGLFTSWAKVEKSSPGLPWPSPVAKKPYLCTMEELLGAMFVTNKPFTPNGFLMVKVDIELVVAYTK